MERLDEGTEWEWEVGIESKFPPCLRLFLHKQLLSIYYESNNEKIKEENSYVMYNPLLVSEPKSDFPRFFSYT